MPFKLALCVEMCNDWYQDQLTDVVHIQSVPINGPTILLELPRLAESLQEQLQIAKLLHSDAPILGPMDGGRVFWPRHRHSSTELTCSRRPQDGQAESDESCKDHMNTSFVSYVSNFGII